MRGGGLKRPPTDAGVPSDMETLFEAFQAKQSLRLMAFYDVAIDYGLKSIYSGRMSVAALIEFEESLLDAAFAYVRPRKRYKNGLGEERTLKERIFGVYALFVLYYAQPVDYASKIRATSCDISDLEQFVMNTLIPLRQLEAFGCLHSLFSHDAFMTVAFLKKYDLSHYRKYEMSNPVEMLVDERERYVPLKAVREIMEHPVLKAMAVLQREMEHKQSLTACGIVVTETGDNLLSKLTKLYSLLKDDFNKIDHGSYEEFSNEFKNHTDPEFDNAARISTCFHNEDLEPGPNGNMGTSSSGRLSNYKKKGRYCQKIVFSKEKQAVRRM